MKEKRKAILIAVGIFTACVCLFVVVASASKFILERAFAFLDYELEDGVLYALTPEGPIKANGNYKYEKGVVITETGYTDKMYEQFGPEILYSKEAQYKLGDIKNSWACYCATDYFRATAESNNVYQVTVKDVIEEELEGNYTIIYDMNGSLDSYSLFIN